MDSVHCLVELHYNSQVGDYSTVNKKTDQFESEGNIYEDATWHQTIPENISSSSVKRHELSLNHEL